MAVYIGSLFSFKSEIFILVTASYLLVPQKMNSLGISSLKPNLDRFHYMVLGTNTEIKIDLPSAPKKVFCFT